MKFDFSQYHPLDHSWWEPRCSSLYGGIRRHASIWWNYASNAWLHPLSWVGLIKCKLGHHDRQRYWNSISGNDAAPAGFMCRWCWREL